MKLLPEIPLNAKSRRILLWVLLLAALMLLGVSLRVQFMASYFGDKQWEMVYAQMLLGGRGLYTGIFPVSTPLIYWIYALLAALTRHLAWPAEFNALITLGLCAIALSIFLCVRLVALHPDFAASRKMRVEYVLLLCFVLIFRASPIYFMDREHLFFVLTLPYLFRFMPSAMQASVPRMLSVAAGILAGIGFNIKPYCFAVWAGIMLVACLKAKSLRPLLALENLIIYVLSIIYVLAIAWLTPDYFSTVLPMALVTYSAARDAHSVFDYLANAVAVLLLTFLFFRPRLTSPYRSDIYYFLALCPFFLLYVMINNNWAYTYFPLGSIALILTGFVAWEFAYLRRECKAQMLPTRAFTLGICACLLTFGYKTAVTLNYFSLVFVDNCHENIHCRADDVFIDEVKGRDKTLSFGAISIDFSRWTRLVHYTGAAWQTRFPQLWMLPKFLVEDKKFTQDHVWILDYVANAFADDMDQYKPDIMFVDDSDIYYTALRNIDLVAFFSGNPHFRSAFEHYRFVHRIIVCGAPGLPYHGIKDRCSYFVYRRIPDEP